MRELLSNIIAHTGGLGFFDAVKITGTKTETLLEAMDNDRTVILKAKLNEPEPKFTGEFGMSRFSLLNGFLNFPTYKSDDATFEIKYKDQDGVKTPQELVFGDGNGQTSNYRFMAAELIPEQARFVGVNWDVSVEPTRSAMQSYMQMSGIMSSTEGYFLAKTVNNSLKFYIGDEDSSTDRACVVLADNINGSLRGDLYWDSKTVVPVMKLGIDEKLTMDFSNKGALRIAMTSPFATYEFLFPARKK